MLANKKIIKQTYTIYDEVLKCSGFFIQESSKKEKKIGLYKIPELELKTPSNRKIDPNFLLLEED